MTVSAHFQANAAPRRSHGFCLESAVLEAYATFAELKGQVVFADQDKKPAGLRALGAEDRRKAPALLNRIGALGPYKGVCYFVQPDKRVILLRDDKDQQSPEDVMAKFFVFDHELAHATIKDANYSGSASVTLAESIADTYALLRHMQRFGVDSPMLDTFFHTRAIDGFFRKESYVPLGHFSAPALLPVIAHRHSFSIETRDPRQTQQLALRLALEHTPNFGQLQLLAQTAFANDKSKAHTREGLRRLANVTLKTDMPAPFIWGRIVLTGLMDGKYRPLFIDKKDLPDLTTPEWASIRKKIDARHAEYLKNPQTFALRGMPVRAPRDTAARAAGIKTPG